MALSLIHICYRIVETLGEQSYAIGFRTDDYVRYYVEAALQELAADGTVNSIAGQWFTQNNTHFTARSGALSQFSGIPQRTLICLLYTSRARWCRASRGRL